MILPQLIFSSQSSDNEFLAVILMVIILWIFFYSEYRSIRDHCNLIQGVLDLSMLSFLAILLYLKVIYNHLIRFPFIFFTHDFSFIFPLYFQHSMELSIFTFNYLTEMFFNSIFMHIKVINLQKVGFKDQHEASFLLNFLNFWYIFEKFLDIYLLISFCKDFTCFMP